MSVAGDDSSLISVDENITGADELNISLLYEGEIDSSTSMDIPPCGQHQDVKIESGHNPHMTGDVSLSTPSDEGSSRNVGITTGSSKHHQQDAHSGHITLTTGSSNAIVGNIDLMAGTTVTSIMGDPSSLVDQAGSINLQGGNASGPRSVGGDVQITAGSVINSDSSKGGEVKIKGGGSIFEGDATSNFGPTNDNGGAVSIDGGNVLAGTGGNF